MNAPEPNPTSQGARAQSIIAGGVRPVPTSVPGLLRIEAPFHGAVMHERLGERVPGGLKIAVFGEAPLRDRVTVNGQLAAREGCSFRADIVLGGEINDITAVSEGTFGRQRHEIRVVWDRHSHRRYRFAIDDNIFFLRDIFQKGYRSLFDCFYLKILKDLHDRYGTRFVLNIYFTDGADFSLTQFSDRYRGEWRDNADWLKLAFHAYANDPDRPYEYAPVGRFLADYDLVTEQILRFGGAEVCTPPTVIHWAEAPREALRPLHQRGVRVLSGVFAFAFGKWDGSYHLDDVRSEYLRRHHALMDFDSGIVFSKEDIVCNNVPAEATVPHLEAIAADPGQAEVMDCFTHEQYFWPFYPRHVPDHAKRLETTVRWLTEHGYKPVFFHEGFMGALPPNPSRPAD